MDARYDRFRLILLVAALLAPGAAGATGAAEGAQGPLRTAYTHIDVVVDGDLARTTVVQVFQNDLDGEVEAVYRFPLPGDAVVTGFAEWRGADRVEARVADKDAARDAYEAAAEDGRAASLGEATDDAGRGGFEMSLLALPARGRRRVELKYVQTLSALAGERTYVFPASRAEGEAASTVLDVAVRVLSGRRLIELQSLNHPNARVERGATAGEVRLSRTRSKAGAGLGRDLVVRWRAETDPVDLAARAVRPYADGPAWLETRLAFNADPDSAHRSPRDVVIVLDASLSMAGGPLERARTIARRVVASLDPQDRVALVMFRGLLLQSAEVPERLDAAARERLGKMIDDARAAGRSDLNGAIAAAADMLVGAEDGVLVVLSDGQPTVAAGEKLYTGEVDDPEGLYALRLEAARREALGDARVVFAQMGYPSRGDAIQRVFGDAVVEYVPDGDGAEPVIEDIARLVTAPTIEDLQVAFAGGDVFDRHTGAGRDGRLPGRIAVGTSIRLMARAESRFGALEVRATGRLHGRPVELARTVVLPEGPEPEGDRGLPLEWARLRVGDLESRLGAPGLKETDRTAIADEIRTLGKTHRLATRFTSFVRVEDSLYPDRIKPGDPEIRIHAPRAVAGVRGVLPWGETVHCAWNEEEGLWLGRFLVPRHIEDGLYRMRVFVDDQAGTHLRRTLWVRVDSRPPELELAVEGAPTTGGIVRLVARAVDGVFEEDGDSIRRDLVDMKRIVVRMGDREVPLVRVDPDRDIWTAEVTLDLAPGAHVLRLLASDYARNAFTAEVEVEVAAPTGWARR